MAKKAKKQNKKASSNKLPENMLPQNILPIGVHVEENKNIYISQAVYKDIHKFTKNKTTNESGGMLIGTVIEEFGKINILISGFIEAKFCEATPTTLKFTHETWEFVHKEIEKKHKGKKILGWIHTHPDFGIFLSEYDKFIHQNFFGEAYQVAYVVDPLQDIEGFYFWINGNIEKCKGFYVYDKIGVQISVDAGKNEPAEKKTETSLFSIKNILITTLSVAMAFLFFSNVSTNKQLRELKAQQQTHTASANQAFSWMQQMIVSQNGEIQDIKDALVKAGLIQESETPVAPDNNTSTDNGAGSSEKDTADNPTDSTEGDAETNE